jgi:L-malate glycosyltransferase
MKLLSLTNLCHGFAASLPERALYKGLKARGAELTVITHFSTAESVELEEAGIKVVYLPIKKKFDLVVIREIRRIISEERIEILHVTFGKGLTNGLLASRGTGCKIVAYLGSVRVHWHDPFAWISYLNRRVDRLICLSKGVEEHVLRQAPLRMKRKTVQIYKGYELSWFEKIKPVNRADLGIPPDAFLICCVANVRKVKGIPWLIKASAKLPEGLPFYFMLIGPGMDSEELKELISGSSYRDNFRTFGFTNEVLSFTAACDLYVQPSVTEGLGRSVQEAMCLGKPVVLTGLGGVGELVSEGTNGFHIPAVSSDVIAEKILWCYEHRELLPGMGLSSKKRIETVFSSTQMIEKTWDLFSSLNR